MFFSDRVPPEARDAYNKDAMSTVLVAIMTGMTFPFVAVIARYRLHASDLEIAFLSMAPVAGNLLALIWANMMQGRRKMPFAVWPWIIARSLFFLVIFATCSKVFVSIVCLFYLICSIAAPAYSALIKEIYPDGDRAKIMGYVRIWNTVVLIIVTLAAGKLMERVSYRYVLPVAAMFGVVSALVFNRIHARETTGDPAVRLHHFVADSLRLLVEDKGYLWFCMATFVFGFANFMATPIYALYEVDVLRAHEFRQSIYFLVATGMAMLSYFFWGDFVDRRRPEKVVTWQIIAWAFIPLTYVIASKWWMLLPAKALVGFIGAGNELVYLTGVIYFAPPGRLTQYYGVFMTLMGIRGITAPFLAGALVQWHVTSMQTLFLISAGLTLVAAVVQIAAYRKYDRLA